MPTATLTYHLPDDDGDFNIALSGARFMRVITEMDEFLRRKIKYEELSGPELAAFQEARTYLYQLRDEYGVAGSLDWQPSAAS